MKSQTTLFLIALVIVALMPLSISVATPENHHVPRLYRGTTFYEPQPDYSPQPFMGAYMDTNGLHFHVKKTRVTVSFPDTNPSVIQTDNWLEGIMPELMNNMEGTLNGNI